MRFHEFTLRFSIAEAGMDTDALIEKLYESGCDDALIGSSQPGYVSLQFSREASTAEQAIRRADRDVQKTFPQAVLEGSEFDYVLLNADLSAQISESQKTHADGRGYKPTTEQLENICDD